MSQGDLDDIRRRAVEREAAGARVLGGSAYRDVSDIRAEIRDFHQRKS